MGRHQQNRRYLTAVLPFLLMWRTGRAEDMPPGLQIIPKWAMSATTEGQRACYDKDGAKKLILLDGQLVVCRAQGEELIVSRDLNKALEDKTDAQAAVIRSLRSQVEVLKIESETKKTESLMSLGLMSGLIGFTVGVLTTVALMR